MRRSVAGPEGIPRPRPAAFAAPLAVLGVACAGAAVVFAAVWLSAGRAERAGDGVETFVPAAGEFVVERLPSQAAASKRDLQMRQALRRDGAERADAADRSDRSDASDAARVELARRHLQRGRLGGDPREIGLAQSALGPDWIAEDATVPVLLVRAAIHQYQHAFDAALADLRRVTGKDPANLQGWLSQAAIQQTTGALADAARSCSEIVRRWDHVAGHVCAADLASLRGDPGALDRALALIGTRRVGASERSWVLTVVAEMAERAGRNDDAERLFRAAVAAGSDSYPAVAYADWLLARGRAVEVAALLAGAPATDAVQLRRALAWQATGDPRAAAVISELRDRFASSRSRSDSLHLREMARFALEIERDPETAVGLAIRNWSLQKEPADALLLAAAARAAGRPAATEPVRRFRLDPGFTDLRLDALL